MITLRFLSSRSVAGAVSLLFVAGVASLNLHYPFVSDQLVALYAARSMTEGGTLYVDFWDNKMPGLYWFYVLAGQLYSLSEFGIHLFEIIWMLAFGLILIVTTVNYLPDHRAAAAAPIAVIGTYFATADPFHLTQLEILSGLPLYLSLWFATHYDKPARRAGVMLFFSGALAASAAVFKLILAPICVLGWLIVSVSAIGRDRWSFRQIILTIWMPVAIGVTAVLGSVALTFAQRDALDALLWTAFTYPPQALDSSPPASVLRLAESSMFFIAAFSAWLVFAVIAIYDWSVRERNLLTSLLIAWAVSACVVILVQRFSWWAYHFLLLFPPIGLLAARGVQITVDAIKTAPTTSMLPRNWLLAALLVPALLAVIYPASHKVAAHTEIYLRKGGNHNDFRAFISADYGQIPNSVKFLNASQARPGPIYVFGTPLYYYLAGRKPALSIIGWPWQYFLDSQWLRLPAQLDEALPPYIYVDTQNEKILQMRDPAVKTYLARNYFPFAKDHNGTWFQVSPSKWDARKASQEDAP